MTRALIPECPPILDPEIDLNKGQRNLRKTIYSLGSHFTCHRGKIKKAIEKAWETDAAYRKRTADWGVMPAQAIDRMCGKDCEPDSTLNLSPELKIALIGHPYVIYDDYINHRLISRLQAMGAEISTPEMADQGALDVAMAKLGGNPHWTFEADIIGAGEFYLEAKVDGVITVAVFGCGPDSMMIDVVRHRAREFEVPFLHLSLDEHSSEGGLITRLEAFLDMVKRRKRVCV